MTRCLEREHMGCRVLRAALWLMLAGAGTGAVAAPAQSPDAAPKWLHLSSAFGDLPVPGASHQQTASAVLDIDRDGRQDFVIGARQRAPALVSYRRRAAGWERAVIEPDLLPIEAGSAVHDIDQDGDLDIVMGEDASGNRVYWWENPHPAHDRRWTRRVIKDAGANKHHDQIFGDFDGDGEAELVFWNQHANRLFLAEIPDDPKSTEPWPYVAIFESEGAAEGLAKADVDGDGKVDLIGGGRWFEHAGGTRFIPHLIDPAMPFTRAAAGQLKEGGRVEVVLVVGDGTSPLKWYEWTGDAWQGHDLLGFEVNHGHTLEVADLDGDGHLDILCAEMHTPGAGDDASLWIFYGDGKGNFQWVRATGIGNHESKVADLDGDRDLDLLMKPYTWQAPRIDVLLNRRTRLDRWARHVIEAKKPWRSVFVVPGDLDGDGDLDLATGGWWYENPGDLGDAWIRHTIGAPLNNVAAVHDFDGDGDLDILGTQGEGSQANATFALARNDGEVGFSVFAEVAQAGGDFLQGVAVGRFTGDALEVALSWHAAGHGVQMLTVPDDPAAAPWPLRTISEVAQDEALSAGDIDRDGRLDLLLGTKWLRNTGSGFEAHTLADGPVPDRNRLADLDGDGRLDAVVGAEAVSRPGELVWFAQPAVAGDPWPKHPIATITGPMSLDVADLDGDGDLDLAVGEHDLGNPGRAKLHLLENADGSGGAWIGHIVALGDEHHDGAILADLDGDGDLDITSIGWSHPRVLVYENLAAR